MRIALITTSVAAVLAVPMTVAAAGPQMTSSEFLSAVRCLAYESATSPSVDLGAEKMRLNTEAGKQPDAVVAAARREATMIGAAAQGGERTGPQACDASRIADEGRAARAV